MPTPAQVQLQDEKRRAEVAEAVRAVTTPGRRCVYGGSAAVSHNPRFLAIDEPPESPNRKTRFTGPSSIEGEFSPKPPVIRQVRDGAHVGHMAGVNPLKQARLDPVAEALMKVKDPVGYHVYRNQRAWVTQSTIIGEFNRVPVAERPPRLPSAETLPVGASRREGLRALRASSARALGDNAKPGDLEAVSPTRQGYIPPAPRQAGDMDTQSKLSFVNPRTHPEPATCKAPKFLDKPFVSKWPTDTSARDAVDSMRNMDGTLTKERPEKVHPSVWARVTKTEKALSMDDPHAHKKRAPGWYGGSVALSSPGSTMNRSATRGSVAA